MFNKLSIKLGALLLAVALLAAGCSQSQAPAQDNMVPAEDNMAPAENSMTAQPKSEAESSEEPLIPMAADDSEQLNKGYPAKDFTLKDLNGDTYTLSDFRGQKVYIKLWASWCSICLAGMEEIDMLSGEDNDFVVFTVVSPDHNGELSTDEFVTWYKGLENENMIVLLDETGEVMKSFNVRAFPTSVYIGTDGILAHTALGHRSNDQIKETMETIQ